MNLKHGTTGSPIVGTLQNLRGTAGVTDFPIKNGQIDHENIEWQGETEIDWDTQDTARDEFGTGAILLVCEDGAICVFDDCVEDV